MTEAEQIIAELTKLVDSLQTTTQLEARSTYHAEIKARIARLRKLAGQPGDAYVREKISDVEQHVTAIAGIQDDNQHDRIRHVAWAHAALNTLRGLKVGEQRDA